MRVEGDPHATHAYTIATFALWAGDFDYCQRRLKEFAPGGEFGKIPDSVEGPIQLVQYVAALRQRQLRQKKGEYKKLTADHLLAGYDLSGNPSILETRHLRGVIWRPGARQFQMLGYLSDLSWELQFFERVKILTAELGEEKPPPRGVKSSAPWETNMGRGGSWIIRGSLFVQVTVSDLGHIEADGTWTESLLPKEVRQIKEAFIRVLEGLDEAMQK